MKLILQMTLGLVVGLGGALLCSAQTQTNPGSAAIAVQTPGNKPSATLVAPKAQWLQLTMAQQKALAPLSPLWATLSETQRSKWLAISKNFAHLSESEQITMHSRMADWATLTPQQRIQARLNFGETNRIPQSEKKAQWQAYQALPDEEKRKLGAAQPTPVTGAAPAPRPAAPGKLSHVQTPNGQLPIKGKTPEVKDLDKKTLLPPTKTAQPKADEPTS
jgi:hypothetical protein